MGCDIHAILEIKKDGEWQYIKDLPSIFDVRYYNLFSILNKNVRNCCGIDGFEGKGKPLDTKNRKARFYSYGEDLERAYRKSTILCKVVKDDGEIEYISPLDTELIVEIDAEFCEHLLKEKTEEENKRYMYPYYQGSSIIVRDAYKIGGEFVKVTFEEVYHDIKKFNDEYCHYPWNEEEQDFGFYEFDLDCTDYHSHSYLTLEEMKTKAIKTNEDEVFVVDEKFLQLLERELGGVPDFLHYGEKVDEQRQVCFIDSDISLAWHSYFDGVNEIEEIKRKYNIESDEDIRLVFAFDS